MASNTAILAQISTILSQKYSLSVSSAWLSTNLSSLSSDPAPPLPSITQTALFRLLNSDFTISLSKDDPNSVFTSNINDPNIKEQRLTGDVPAQLLSIEDVGTSRWSQTEAIERVERGEEVRGREIVRAVDVDRPGASAGVVTATPSTGPYKLVLQDARGTKVIGFAKERIEKMSLGDKECVIGVKVMLKKDVVVRRGMLMLGCGSLTVLGGKVEAWDKMWKQEAKERLTNALSETQR
jgi:RecQ-mediated genome instability protein 1